jgi:hypothetical protein
VTSREEPSFHSDARARSTLGTGIAFAVPVVLFALHVLLYIRYVNDDAYITFRYSRALASGHGPYFNVGEHVEGYTNFLQMLLMSGVYLVGGEATVPVFAKALGIVSGAGALLIAAVLAAALSRSNPLLAPLGLATGSLAASLVAIFPGFALNSASGLETSLFAMLIALGVWRALLGERSGRWAGAGLAWAAAALTRPEGLAVFGVHTVGAIAARALGARDAPSAAGRPRSPVLPSHIGRDAVLVLAAVGAQLAFRVAFYDGAWLPNTYHAKTLGFWGLTPWDYVRNGALAPFAGIVGVAAGLYGLARSGPTGRQALPMTAVAIFGAGLPFLVGTDWMPGWRFSVPYLPLLAVVVALGWVRVVVPMARRAELVVPAIAVVVVAALAIVHHAERRDFAALVDLRARGYATGHRRLCTWLQEEGLKPGDTVALMDIGIVGYYCPDQRILDITGLTDAHIARSPGTFLKKRYDPSYILDQEPEAIVLVLSAFEEVAPAGGDVAEIEKRVVDPAGPFPDHAQLATWIPIEAQILAEPQFEARYQRLREDPGPEAPLTERIAARIGAERVFEHAYPDQLYLLAAFRRHAEAGADPPRGQLGESTRR